MKYIKKKANQEQSTYSNLFVNAKNLEQNPQAAQMEYNSAGLPSSGEKVFDINSMIMNPNRKATQPIGLADSVYYNDPVGL
jgi:hypothetical protein